LHIACLFLSQEEVYLRWERNASIFQAFLGVFSRYAGACVAKFDEKGKGRKEKERLMMAQQVMRESPSSKCAWQRDKLSKKPGKIDVK